MNQPSQSVLITGASGFVGSALIAHWPRQGDASVTAAFRRSEAAVPSNGQAFFGLQLEADTDWRPALRGRDCIVHTAARVHVMNEGDSDALARFRKVNVDGSLNLARQAAMAGVRRFVYVSSIKVNGEQTIPGHPFTPGDIPAPRDPYSATKLEAEQCLRELADVTGMQLVIVRPPLVYGPGVKANFQRMMHWLRRGVPLPFGAVRNWRSLVGLDNLCDLLVTCARHPAAAGHTFLAGDGEDVSTSELLRRLGLALGRPARLLPVPARLLQAGLTALGRRDIGQRLCSSLQVDISETCATLGWSPPVSLDEGLRRAAQAYLAEAGEAGAASR